MRVTSLSLRDVRCHANLDLDLDAGCTLLVGGNGAGKTTVLEALHWLGTGRSFRRVPDEALVRTGCGAATIRARVQSGSRVRLVHAEIPVPGRARLLLDGTAHRRGSDVVPMQATVFSPDDLELVKGGPQVRREYLDELLVVLVPRLRAVRDDLGRTLRQRNALLRRGLRSRSDAATLAVLTERFAGLSGELVAGRWTLVARLLPGLRAAVGALDPVSGVEAAYRCSWADPGPGADGWAGKGGAAADGGPPPAELAETLGTALAARADLEAERGLTTLGPHRDDLSLELGGRDARTQGSQGEQRTLALALRLAAHGLVTEVLGAEPILLLDDVFSELDDRRSAALVALVGGAGQAVITATHDPPQGIRPAATIELRAGSLSPAA